MPKFVIERVVPGAGKLSSEELRSISETSCSVIAKLGPQIQWIHSFVSDNKIYCVYISPNEALIREHAKLAGIPANQISQIGTVIDPTTAER